VQVTFASVASVLRFVQSGRLRALAVTSVERSPQLAAVPTMKEAGVADVQLTSWYGLLAPAGTPPEVVKKIAADLAAVMASPVLGNGFAAQGLDLVRDSPAQFAAFIRDEAEKYARIAKAARIEQE
jgi:tripartite-type tricarboxylate transporter receptor subunit TctC